MEDFNLGGLKVARAGQIRLGFDGRTAEELEVEAPAEIRVRLVGRVRVIPNDNVVAAAEYRPVRGIAADGILVAGLDGHQQRLAALAAIDQAEQERLRVLFVFARAVPGDGRIAAEDAIVCRAYDRERVRLVVALGVEARCFEAVLCRSVEELELLAAQLAQLDELVLHAIGANNGRVDKTRVQLAAHALEPSAARGARVQRRPEADRLLANNRLGELVVESAHLAEQEVTIELYVSPLVLVAVECLQREVDALLVEDGRVLGQLALDGGHLALESLFDFGRVHALGLALVHLVQELLVVSAQPVHVRLALYHDVGLQPLEVVEHVAVRVELGKLVEQLRDGAEAALGRVVLAAVLHVEQQRDVLVRHETHSVVVRVRVDLVTEVALDHL